MQNKIIITFLFQMIFSTNLFPYWFKIQPPGFHLFSSVHYVHHDLAFVSTDDGEIFKTTDGGYNWQLISNLTSLSLLKIRFQDAVGIAVGENGIILRSVDMGNNWNIIQSITNNWLYDFDFLSNNTIVAVGNNGSILRSIDRGANWIQINSGTNELLHGMDFIDSLNGFIVGWNQTILKTSDGGSSWTASILPYDDDYSDICFSDSLKGIAVGKWGTIIRTLDGGVTWNYIGNYGDGFIKAELISDQVCWAVGYSNLTFKTSDGGQTWLEINSPVANQGALSDVSFVDENYGMTVGSNNVILKTERGGLPVELMNFSASFESGKISLRWITSSELNNHGFEIERSADKVNWRIIGFKEGNGTTTEIHNYTFIDDLFRDNYITTFYRLKQIDFNGTFEYSDIVEVDIAPTDFSLSQNYPNPFNPSTNIQYTVSSRQFVSLKVYDGLGREVAILVNEEKQPGEYEVDFDASKLSSGIYIYQLKSGSYISSRKMTVLK